MDKQINISDLKKITYQLSKDIGIQYQNFYSYNLIFKNRDKLSSLSRGYRTLRQLINDNNISNKEVLHFIVNGKWNYSLENTNSIDSIINITQTAGFNSLVLTDHEGDIDSVFNYTEINVLEVDKDTDIEDIHRFKSSRDDNTVTVYFKFYF